MAVAKSEYEEHLFYVIFDNYVHNYVHKQLFYKTMCQRSCFNRTCEEVIIVFGEIENYFYLTKRKVHDFTYATEAIFRNKIVAI